MKGRLEQIRNVINILLKALNFVTDLITQTKEMKLRHDKRKETTHMKREYKHLRGENKVEE
jgi:hypothetical protein